MKANNAKGNSAELAKMLDGVYRYIYTDRNVTYDSMMEKAAEAAQWIYDNRVESRDAYAQEVLDYLKGRHVSLSDSQRGEAEYAYGSLSAYRSAMKGSIILDSKAGTTLDQLWQEAASKYPGTFDSGITDGDMPGALADIVNALRESKSEDSLNAEYYADEDIQNIAHSIIRSSEKAKAIKSTADTYRQRIAKIQEANKQALKDYQAKRDEQMETARKQYNEDLKKTGMHGKPATSGGTSKPKNGKCATGWGTLPRC